MTIHNIGNGHINAHMNPGVESHAFGFNLFGPAVDAIEAQDPATFGNIGGAGLPIILSWVVGGLFAGLAAWLISKIALGLRSDYLAIATLGISEIVLAVLKSRPIAEEVAQEVYVQIWRQSARFDGHKGNPTGWIAAIARNMPGVLVMT